MSFKSLRPLSVLFALTFGILTTGCGGEGGGSGSKDAEVLVVNACSAPGTLAFFFNDKKYGGDLAYRAQSTFVTLPELSADQGGYDVSLEDSSRANFWDSIQQSFATDSSTILVAIGIKNPASGEELKRLRMVQTTPNRNAPIGNRARLIIVHGFNRKPGFGTTKLIFQNDPDNPTFQSTQMKFGEFAVLEVDSGTYSGSGKWIAKDPDNEQVYIQAATPTVLKPAGIYLVILSGVEGGTPTMDFKEIAPKV